MTLSERLIETRKRFRLERDEFAGRIGRSERTVQRWELENAMPKGEELARIAKEFNVNIHWLLTGEGRSFFPSREVGVTGTQVVRSSVGDDDSLAPKSRQQDETAVNPGIFKMIPRAEARLSAGDGALVLSEEFAESYAFRRDWLSRVATSSDNVILMSVLGDSMYPTIQEGDMVMVDRGRDYPQSGKVFAFTPGDNIVQIKRLESRGKNIRIISDNSSIYQPFDLPSDQIRIIGQVIWFARQLVLDR